jgi:hypothetical protein
MLSILRDHETYGPFGMDLIHAMLEEGRIVPSDLAREEGGKWKPLEVFLREPALLHSSPLVPARAIAAVTQGEKSYLNSPRAGERNLAPYLAASFPSGHKPFKIRLEEFCGYMVLGVLLLLVPFIGWILGPLVMLGGFVQLFDNRPDPKNFEESCARMIGDFHRDGYRDLFLLFLGASAILFGIASLAAAFLAELSVSCAQGFCIIGVVLLMMGMSWTYNYFVPKHLRK